MANTAHTIVAHPRRLRADWVVRAVSSGFIASIVALLALLGAYALAYAFSSTNPAASTAAKWSHGLISNPVTSFVANVHMLQAIGLHFGVGIVWALIYAAFIEPQVAGPGWRKGLIFAFIPLLFSELIFLPAIGAGVFGMSTHSGPLAGTGLVILHAVYGVVLGEIYALAEGEAHGGPGGSVSRRVTAVERTAVIAMIVGALSGAILAVALEWFGVALTGTTQMGYVAVGGATEGLFTGIVVGVFLGFIVADGLESD